MIVVVLFLLLLVPYQESRLLPLASGLVITMEQEVYPVGTEVVSATLENRFRHRVDYGLDFELQYRQGHRWLPVEDKSAGFERIGMLLLPGTTRSRDFDLTLYADELPAGRYRILFGVSHVLWGDPIFHTLSVVEFELAE